MGNLEEKLNFVDAGEGKDSPGTFAKKLRSALFDTAAQAGKKLGIPGRGNTISKYETDVIRPKSGYYAKLAKMLVDDMVMHDASLEEVEAARRFLLTQLQKYARFYETRQVFRSWTEVGELADHYRRARNQAEEAASSERREHSEGGRGRHRGAHDAGTPHAPAQAEGALDPAVRVRRRRDAAAWIAPRAGHAGIAPALYRGSFPGGGAGERAHTSGQRELAPQPHIANQPLGWTAFVGRRAEISRLRDILDASATRLLTLTGTAGVGKTRLAVEVARQCAARFQHGAVFVPLAPITDASEIPNQVAKALGRQEKSTLSDPYAGIAGAAPDSGPNDTAWGFLRNRHMLLVLDNTEQIAGIGTAVREIFETDPSGERLKVLIASREPTHLPNEVVYAVPPMKIPDAAHLPSPEGMLAYDAVQLFIAAAKQRLPGFEIDTVSKARSVAEICSLADGLPLGIQTAVGRLKQWSLPTIASMLRKDKLKLASRDILVPERHRTLEKAIDWSFKLLSSGEQKLFKRLSVFQGGCRSDAVRSICAADGEIDPAEVDDLLWDLSEKSLIQPLEFEHEVAFPWYAMLPTLRAYALDKLVSDSHAETIGKAHVDYYLELATCATEELRGNRQLEWLQRLGSEEDNLRAALNWSLERGEAVYALRLSAALWPFWWIRARFSEGARWLEKALTLAVNTRDDSSPYYADAGVGACVLALEERRFSDAEHFLRQSEAIYLESNNVAGLAYAFMFRSALANATGSSAMSAKFSSQSVSLLRANGDRWALALALYYAGYAGEGEDSQFITWNRLHGLEASRLAYEESIALFASIGDDWGLALATIGLANLKYRNRGRAEAYHLYKEGVKLLRKVGATGQMCYALSTLGNIALVEGSFEEAKGYFEEALPIHQEQNNLYNLAYSYNGLGEIARHEGRFAEAAAYYRSAIALRVELRGTYEKAGDARRTLETIFPLAWEYQNLGAALYLLDARFGGEALACYKEALLLFRTIGILPGTKPGIICCLAGLAALSARASDYRTAAALFGASDARLEGSSRKEPEAVLQPADLAHYNLVRERAQRDIEKAGRDLWEHGRLIGRRLAWEEAVSIALGERTANAPKAENDLTARELEVLKLRAHGLQTNKILEQLVISRYTLVEHERKIRRKLGVKQIFAAITRARELGLLD